MTLILDASMPGPSEKKTLHVRPGDTIDFKDLALEKVFVDILGPDIIVTDGQTGAKLIFPSLGLILFSKDDAPVMLDRGETLTAQELLSKVGRVHNITSEDYVSFTSIDLDPGKHDSNDDKSNKDSKEELLVDNDLAIVMVQSLQQPQKSGADPEMAKKEVEEIDTLLDYRSTVNDDAHGTPYLSPLKVSLDKSSAQQQPPEPGPEPDGSARTRFDFDARILQLAAVEPSSGADVLGGGGSELSAFDPGNAAQYLSQETIDKSGDNSGLTIYADNPTFFDNTHGARNIQFSPSLPDDYNITEVKITIQNITGTVTPADFAVYGILHDGAGFNEVAATFDPMTGTFSLPLAAIQPDGRGDVNIALVYDQGFAGDTFEIVLESTAEFDFLSGSPVPDEPVQTRSTTQTVKFTSDYASEGGTFDWYLETMPNDTRIFTGNGDDTVYGGMGTDIIETNGGDDTIYADSGDGGGDDQIDGGEGGETSGDTIVYTGRAEAISVDLGAGGAVADGNGYYDITVGVSGEVDKIKNIENITGSDGNDTIIGDNDAFGNILSGGAGDDLLMGGLGNDTLIGGADIDTISYAYITGSGAGISIDLAAGIVNAGAGDVDTLGDQIEHVIATSRNDTIIGNSLNNDIDGGTGTDIIDYSGRAGTGGLIVDFSTLDVDGFSVLTFGSIAEQDRLKNIENLTGTAQGDNITGDAGNNIYLGLAGNDTIRGGGGDDTISGGDDDDMLFGDAGDDVISGGAGVDVIDGGTNTAAGDTVDYSAESGVLDVDLGTGIVAQDGAGSSDTVSNIENVWGGSGTNTIRGNASDNVMTGGASTDNFYGSLGNDTFTGNGGTNTLDYSELPSGTVDVQWSGAATNTVNKSAGGTDSFTGVQTINGSLGTDTLTLLVAGLTVQSSGAYFSPDGLATLIGVENVEGSGGTDTIYAMNTGTIDNVIHGNGGNDTIYGGDGNHTLDGGSGTDILRFNTAAAITFDLTSSTASFSSYTNTFSGFEEYHLGSGGDTIYGSAGNDGRVYGENGDDVFYSSDGIDSFNGGGGTDTMNFSLATQGAYFDLSFSPGGEIQNDGFGHTETISGIENAIGSNFSDFLVGDANANTLDGGAADDYLYGGSGADTLIGGTQDGVALGGDWVDYFDSPGSVTVNLTTGIANDGWGFVDTLSGIENVFGSANADFLTGDAGDNYLAGYTGSDTFYGTLGNDRLEGDGANDSVYYTTLPSGTISVNSDLTVTKTAGGTDTLSNITHVYGTAGVDSITLLSALTVQSSGAFFSFNGFLTRIQVENVIGSAGNDTIYTMTTGTNNNSIYGNAGDDTVIVGNGNHFLDGGSGGEVSGDLLNLTGTGSNTTLNLSASTATFGAYTSTFANFERYQLGNGTNTITGSAGADGLVTGGTGADTFFASSGIDSFNGGAGTDTYDFSTATNGVNINMTLGSGQVIDDGFGFTETISNVENVNGSGFDDIITGTTGNNVLNGNNGNDTINGDAGNDTINGGSGNDTIDGGSGNDTIDGGSGNDNIMGGSGDDTIVGGTGDDIIDGGTNNAVGAASGGDTANYSSSSTSVTVDLSVVGVNATGTSIGNDTLTNIENINGGSGDDVLRGDNNDNRLTGNNGSDTLNGRGGNDFLYGGNGDDTLIGGAGNDTLDGGANFDTADYSTAAGPITVNLATGAVSNDGDGGTDTLVSIESIIGTTGNDTISSAHNNYTLLGGLGTDTLNYAFTTQGITANLNGFGSTITGTINKTNGAAVTTDSVTSFESFVGGTGNDIFTFNTDAISLLGTVNGGAGSDRLNINDSLSGNNLTDNGISGDTIAGIFSNIEELNLTGATVDGNYDGPDYTVSNDADDFDLTQTNVEALVGVGGTLNLTVSSTFDLYINGATNMGGGVYKWGTTTVNVTAV